MPNRMVACYGFGIRFSVSSYSTKTLDDALNGFVTNNGLAAAHFGASVAVSGSLSPRMFIHLMQARHEQLFTPSRELPSLQFASFPGNDLSICSSVPSRFNDQPVLYSRSHIHRSGQAMLVRLLLQGRLTDINYV